MKQTGRQSLYKHSDQELSLIVFNTESLYNIRHSPRLWLRLHTYYQFTTRQAEVLTQDLKSDALEMEIQKVDIRAQTPDAKHSKKGSHHK